MLSALHVNLRLYGTFTLAYYIDTFSFLQANDLHSALQSEQHAASLKPSRK